MDGAGVVLGVGAGVVVHVLLYKQTHFSALCKRQTIPMFSYNRAGMQ